MFHQPSRATFLTAAGAGLAYAAYPRLARAQTTRIRAAGVFSDLFAEPFYAKASGIFAQHGFDIEPTDLYNAGAVAAAVGGGSLEMGMGDLISGVNAILAGVPILLIAGGGLYRMPTDQGANLLAVAANSPIAEPKDLIGKTIGVPTLVGLTTACLRAWLPQNGVPVAQVRLVEVPPPTVVAALQRGTIDAGLLSEPFVTESKALIRAAGYPFDAVAQLAPDHDFCVSVWYASKKWIDDDLPRGRAVVAAIYDTARWANTHQAATLQVLVDQGKMDAAKLAGMHRVQFATSLGTDLVQPVVTVAEREKLFHKQVAASDLITNLS